MQFPKSKSMLEAYKTIGCFVNGPVTISQTQPFCLATVCYNSFKIYSDSLAIKMVSPCFAHPIRAMHIDNQHTYLIVDKQIIKMRYYHIVNTWQLPSQPSRKHIQLGHKQNASILVFEGLILAAIGAYLYLVPQQLHNDNKQSEQTQIEVMDLQLMIMKIVHPVTYINKIIAYSQNQIRLINPITQKILFDYSHVVADIIQGNAKITLICPSPLIDIVAICLTSGQITILNLRTSKTIFSMKQKHPVTAIAFSTNDSLMVSGDETGNIILWDLQNKIIVYKLQFGFPYAVDSLYFVLGYPLVIGTSSKSNSVRQFRINLDDCKTLSLFRQRTGCSTIYPINNVKCHSNKEITFSTQHETIFSSLYSHCNMYTLPHCLDSNIPYHISAKNFNVEVYRERTVIGKLNIHQKAQIGLFSMSKKFVVVGTKSRIIKIAIPGGVKPSTLLHISCEWKISNPLQIILCKQQSIYAFCSSSIYVFNFNEPTLLATLDDGDSCHHAVVNGNQTLLAFQNRTKQIIQIWDMRNISVSRQFEKMNNFDCTCLCFTTDSRYLLQAQVDCTLLVWSLLHSTLYKVIKLQNKIIGMNFTPDNAYLLTVLDNAKQINIWWNYIGKIMSSQNEHETYRFETSLNYLPKDYRQNLTNHKQFHKTKTEKLDFGELDNLLDQIEDSVDINDCNYSFQNVGKWMPLIYYDQIKNRNSINDNNEVPPALPFFLDFKNFTEEQEKIKKQLKQQSINKKNRHQQKIDEEISKNSHEIRLNANSTNAEYQKTWQILCSLSIAQVDYQLRRYLLIPTNLTNLLKMSIHILTNKKYGNLMLSNIIITRMLDLAGTQLCSKQCKEEGAQLLGIIKELIGMQEQVVERCAAIGTY